MTDAGAITLVKLAHLAALVLWLGPALGAWWMLRRALFRFDDPGLVSHFLYRAFLRFLWLEHAALVALLVSGALLVGLTHADQSEWLRYKLLLVALIVLPLEIVDIWFSHVRLPAILRRRHPSQPYAAAELRTLRIYHNRFTPTTVLLLPVTIVVIMWLAIGKPS